MDLRGVIDTYFAAMRLGPDGAQDMLALFTENAVYVEPFTGQSEPAVGIDEIRDRLRVGWEAPLPEMELDVLEIEILGATARSRWECRSPALPDDMQGEDRYWFEDGKIARLEVILLHDPSER